MANNQPTEFFGKYSQEEIEVTFKKINEIIESPINQKLLHIFLYMITSQFLFHTDDPQYSQILTL